MKYIYKGMEALDESSNCAVLLNWHEKVGSFMFTSIVTGLLISSHMPLKQLTELAGVGCIVRTMADHRLV
jgi:hypothetical protein